MEIGGAGMERGRALDWGIGWREGEIEIGE
jgi:hypothetical protein